MYYYYYVIVISISKIYGGAMEKINIDSEFITLTQFLKISNIVSSGGEAKYFILENQIFLNNELENRRKKKIFPGDIISINNIQYEIINEN